MSEEYLNIASDEIEVFDVEMDQNSQTATIFVRETVEEVHKFDSLDLDDKTVRHSHLWKCEKTQDGDIETPIAAGEEVEQIVEKYPVDFEK